jgi:hypothetical protein
MRRQRKALLQWTSDHHFLPNSFPDWGHFQLGALQMSYRITPIISGMWEESGTRFATRVGLDPNEWSVTNPYTADKIRKSVLDFCTETNNATTLRLDKALAGLRQELHEGIVERGESIEQLTKRVQGIFTEATQSRARTIAQTETSRAVHAAQNDAARVSGVVTGWRWQLSSDACPVCVAIAARNPVVRLGQPFAVIGKNPIYSHIFVPPAHPRCNCTVQEVLDIDRHHDYGNGPLVNPAAATDEELQTIRTQRQERDEAILRGSEQWGAAPYVERYPAVVQTVKPRPTRQPPAKVPPKKPRERFVRAPYEPAELPGQPLRPGEQLIGPKSFDEGQHPRDEHGRW